MKKAARRKSTVIVAKHKRRWNMKGIINKTDMNDSHWREWWKGRKLISILKVREDHDRNVEQIKDKSSLWGKMMNLILDIQILSSSQGQGETGEGKGPK